MVMFSSPNPRVIAQCFDYAHCAVVGIRGGGVRAARNYFVSWCINSFLQLVSIKQTTS